MVISMIILSILAGIALSFWAEEPGDDAYQKAEVAEVKGE
jgi:type II secretory pathway pseudopilin PulG